MSGDAVRAVVMTNRLVQWGGAEIVTCEFAEELAGRGLDVCVYAHFVSEKIGVMLGQRGITTISDPDGVDVAGADIAYSHHQIASLLLSRQAKRDGGLKANLPLFVYNHLSPYEPLETPGPFVEAQLADHIWCNSPETQKMLSGYGVPFERAEVVPNPAPEKFFVTRPQRGEHLGSVLIVSNHVPLEMEQALDLLLRQGIRITRIGHPLDQRRIEPDDILGHDAVITIGKTVQFALASRTPVYCYDHFGGPGWLNDTTFADAEMTNFSGRSRPQRLDASTLAEDIIAGFPAGRDWVTVLPDSVLAKWRLRRHVDGLIDSARRMRNDPERQMRRTHMVREESFLRGLRIEGNIQESLRAEVITRIGLENAHREAQRPRRNRSYFSRLNRALRGKEW